MKGWVYAAIAVLGIFVVSGVFLNAGMNKKNHRLIKASHISQFVKSDRNCNDCHYGDSFISILNNSDDNTVNYILDKANIRRF